MNSLVTSLLITLLITSIITLSSCQQATNNKPESKQSQPVSDLRKMPEFTGSYADILRDYYNIRFTKDGYPSRYRDGEWMDHPMYGAYVLYHYLTRHRDKGEDLKDAIDVVVKATVSRMTYKDDALLFYYPEELGRSKISGLTQSRYLHAFTNLYDFYKDPYYKDLATAVSRSFHISIDDGGFLHCWENNCALEEYPEKPVSFVLNGWLTALWNIKVYLDVIDDPKTDSLYKVNCKTLAKLLPLYDFPEQYNSLYQLRGYLRCKLIADPSDAITIVDLWGENNDTSCYEIHSQSPTYNQQYEPFLNDNDVIKVKDGYQLKEEEAMINIITNRNISSNKDRLFILLKSSQPTEIKLELAMQERVPHLIQSGKYEWNTFKIAELTKGYHIISIVVPEKYLVNSLIPTKFSKLHKGKYHNAYHFIHIDKLNKLYKDTGIEIFNTYAEKWTSYISKWETVPELKNEKYNLNPM